MVNVGLTYPFGHGGGHMTQPGQSEPPLGLFGQHSWGRYQLLARVVKFGECEPGLVCVHLLTTGHESEYRLKQIRANDISESLDVLKFISCSGFCYPTQ